MRTLALAVLCLLVLVQPADARRKKKPRKHGPPAASKPLHAKPSSIRAQPAARTPAPEAARARGPVEQDLSDNEKPPRIGAGT
jgi:hypothetical protein